MNESDNKNLENEEVVAEAAEKFLKNQLKK
jgi:hypothetical protein